jgi:uncharacterized damage-inducible protein DinB
MTNSLEAEALAQVRGALRGKGQFSDMLRLLDALPWRLAGEQPGGAEHSVFRLVGHLNYWQDLYLDRLGGADRPSPPHDAEGWPLGQVPATEQEWVDAAAHFRAALERAEAASGQHALGETLPKWGGRTRLECLLGLALHNAYHAGQIVQLRRMLGVWPPPGGGDSW